MTHFVYESPLSGDVTALADNLSESDHWFYRLTDGEHLALQWIGDRYAVSSVLLGAVSEDGVIDLGWLGCASDVALALASDGIDRVPCLDETTGLALLVWLIGGAA